MPEILLHGFVLPECPCPTDAPPHERVSSRAITALSTVAPADFATYGADDMAVAVLAHHALLQAYCLKGPVLPARFGSLFSSRTALATHLEDLATGITQALHALSCVEEFTLRLSVAAEVDQPRPQIESGREYLARGREHRAGRAALTVRRAALQREISAALLPRALQVETSPTSRPDRLLDVAILLRKADVPDLHSMVQRFGPAAEELHLELSFSGPWPAYSYRPSIAELCDGP
ncbi:GvpL/GvpF family gas vesicle protein [Pseudorhodobacter sp. MZDSW-24AT]|uniref:GvpL/GvpF family gas vesicle protein n=1 Tax=Pseudorhodobacter sp. MZDSW-24AT TaxID=2052957 RepID=UPI000C1F7F67|nr:GvpL/GvpF family gas vesicle protein [Pseudorhodobacter sp. MZDSW-24AT]PJF08886.1 hypothetical protein CUR21_10405 [Pseudorhodobacter sp. MZDSW-24AT]